MHSLKLKTSLHLKIGRPQKQISPSNHRFSSVNLLFVSRRDYIEGNFVAIGVVSILSPKEINAKKMIETIRNSGAPRFIKFLSSVR